FSNLRQRFTLLGQGWRSLAFFSNTAVAMTALVLMLGLGTAGAYAQPAQADNLDAKSYQGAVRQSRNPLSGENYQGGVDPSVVAEQGKTTLEDQPKGLVETVKEMVQDALPNGGDERGAGQTASPSAQPDPTRNPTLKRYENANQ
ncbi:MAG: hypothetical protein WBG38_02455, partial [Nodosilinea sp.]